MSSTIEAVERVAGSTLPLESCCCRSSSSVEDEIKAVEGLLGLRKQPSAVAKEVKAGSRCVRGHHEQL